MIELDNCGSCNYIIRQFKDKYPNIKIELIHNNGVFIAPKNGGIKMEWEYNELIEAINDSYQEYKDAHMSNSEAFARTAGDFETVNNIGTFEKAIVTVALGQLLVRQSKVLIISKENLLSTFESIDRNLLEQHLTPEQFENWLARKERILQEIDKKPVHYYARAFWFYDEMTEEVNQYFKTILLNDKSGKDITTNVLNHFDRDCKHSLSENIAVLITLAENLLEYNIRETDELKKIEQTLNLFNIEDIREQLSDEEMKDLVKRIKNVLAKLPMLSE